MGRRVLPPAPLPTILSGKKKYCTKCRKDMPIEYFTNGNTTCNYGKYEDYVRKMNKRALKKLNPNLPKCTAYSTTNGKKCKFDAIYGGLYCGNHVPATFIPISSSNNSKQSSNNNKQSSNRSDDDTSSDDKSDDDKSDDDKSNTSDDKQTDSAEVEPSKPTKKIKTIIQPKLNQDQSDLIQSKSKLNQDQSDLIQSKSKLNQEQPDLIQPKPKLNQKKPDLKQSKLKLNQKNPNLIQQQQNSNQNNLSESKISVPIILNNNIQTHDDLILTDHLIYETNKLSTLLLNSKCSGVTHLQWDDVYNIINKLKNLVDIKIDK